MKDFLIFLPVTLIFFAFKSTLLYGAALPDLPLVIVFYVAYKRASLEGLVLAFMLGYMEDVFNGSVLGVSSFSFIIVFVVVVQLTKKVRFHGAATVAGGAGVMSLLSNLCSYAILTTKDLHVPLTGYLIPEAIVTALFAPAIVAVIKKVTDKKTPGPDGGHS